MRLGHWTVREWTYPLDDAYIHLSMARNWVTGAGYGAIPNVTASSSSSPLWTLLLAIGFVAKLGSSGPLLLNALFFAWLIGIFSEAIGAHAYFDRLSSRSKGFASRHNAASAGFSVLLLALLPAHALLVSGMEHLAHLTMCVLLLRTTLDRRPSWLLFLLSAIGMGLRFETVFLATATSIVFLRRREWSRALAVLGGALTTLAAVAYFLTAKGLPPIPMSILLKRQALEPTLIVDAFRKGIAAPYLLGFLVLAAAMFFSAERVEKREETSGKEVALVLGMTLGAHLLFAQVGWLYRYDAYLVGLALYAGVRTPELASLRVSKVLLPLVLLGLSVRAIFASSTTAIASKNIADQEGTLVDLVHYARERQGAALGIAVTDIGTIAFEEGGRLVDLMGLASPDVALKKGLRLNHALAEDEVTFLTQGVSLAIINDAWIPRKPKHWRKIATYHIANNRVCASPDTAVYAVHPQNEAKMVTLVTSFVRDAKARPGVTFDLHEPPSSAPF